MARVYKIGKDGKIISGTELVAYAKKKFKSDDSHGMGRSGYPVNVRKALYCLNHCSSVPTMYTKLESENKWKIT